MSDYMDDNDFPTVFSIADNYSIECQKVYLNKIKANGVIASISAACVLLGNDSKIFSLLSIVMLLASVISMWSLVKEKQDKLWYRSRALAESVKSLTWKYVIGGEPFAHGHNIEIIKIDFTSKITGVRDEHRSIFQDLVSSADNLKVITSKMEEIRNLQTEKRAKFYLKERIISQKKWYILKANYNGVRSKFWSRTIVAFLLLALILAVLRIIYPNFEYYPIELCLLFSAFSFTWLQTKKFNELNAAYHLTAHEIADIEVEMEKLIRTNEFNNFPEFISDCENAFSREHTQWLARRDSLS